MPKTFTLANFNAREVGLIRGIGKGERDCSYTRGVYASRVLVAARAHLDKIGVRETRSSPAGRKIYEKLTPAGLAVLDLIRAADKKSAEAARIADRERERIERIKDAGPKLLDALNGVLEALNVRRPHPFHSLEQWAAFAAKHGEGLPRSEAAATLAAIAAVREATEEPQESTDA